MLNLEASVRSAGSKAGACSAADLIEAGLNEGAGEFGPLWGLFNVERVSAAAATGEALSRGIALGQ
jgi:hypothetical protein